jgi:hypothetical protein
VGCNVARPPARTEAGPFRNARPCQWQTPGKGHQSVGLVVAASRSGLKTGSMNKNALAEKKALREEQEILVNEASGI